MSSEKGRTQIEGAREKISADDRRLRFMASPAFNKALTERFWDPPLCPDCQKPMGAVGSCGWSTFACPDCLWLEDQGSINWTEKAWEFICGAATELNGREDPKTGKWRWWSHVEDSKA